MRAIRSESEIDAGIPKHDGFHPQLFATVQEKIASFFTKYGRHPNTVFLGQAEFLQFERLAELSKIHDTPSLHVKPTLYGLNVRTANAVSEVTVALI